MDMGVRRRHKYHQGRIREYSNQEGGLNYGILFALKGLIMGGCAICDVNK